MTRTERTDAGGPAAISRRDMIVGALAVAAGTLVAGAPEVALAANNGPILLAADNYCAGTTKVIRTETDSGSESPRVSVAYFNHIQDEDGAPVTYQALFGATDAAATPSSLGVLGWAHNADHVAVGAVNENAAGLALYASAPNGTAINAVGKVVLSRSGKVKITKGHSSATVTVASGVATTAMILVTPQSDAGGGVYVKYAARTGTNSFKIVLTKNATKSAWFAWMILG